MEPKIVGTYQYVYGAGNAPNREIKFYGNGEKVWACCQAKSNGNWHQTGEVAQDYMILEGASTTEKMRIMMEARETNQESIYPSDKKLENIEYSHRVNVIQNLQPSGPYRITITNNLFKNHRFEIVEKLTFYNPS